MSASINDNERERLITFDEKLGKSGEKENSQDKEQLYGKTCICCGKRVHRYVIFNTQ
jgi:hypothetical protein